MKSSHPRALLLAALAPLALAAASGCSADAEPLYDHGPVRPPEGAGDYVFPTIAYTGYDGNSTFRVPFATNLENVTWEVENPLIATVDPTNAPETYESFGENWCLVTTLGAGTTKVYAVSGGKRVEATIVISQYDRETVAAGATRYYQPVNADENKRVACASCHDAPQGADHSPLEMEFFQDGEILEAITTGAYPDGYVLKNVDHEWDLTDQERAGIVPYLRSLAPRGFF